MNRNVEALWVVEVFLSLLRVQRPTLPGCGLTPHTCRLPHTGLTASLQEHCGLAFPTSGLHDPLTPILYMFMLVFFNLNRRVRKGFQKQVNSLRSSDDLSYWVVDTPGPTGVQPQHQE